MEETDGFKSQLHFPSQVLDALTKFLITNNGPLHTTTAA